MFTLNVVVLVLIVGFGIIGYVLIIWGKYKIAKKIKLTNGILSVQDQKIVERLRIFRWKWPLFILFMIGVLALSFISTILHR